MKNIFKYLVVLISLIILYKINIPEESIYRVNETNKSSQIATLMYVTSVTKLSEALDAFKDTQSDIPFYNTDLFDCKINNSINCTGYTNFNNDIGILSLDEYTELDAGNSSSYLYNDKEYFLIDEGNITTSKNTEEVISSYIRPAAYLDNNTKVKGDGTPDNPYEIYIEPDVTFTGYNYEGNASYEELIAGLGTIYEGSISCQNSSVAILNNDGTIDFSTINAPEYCSIDFIDKTYRVAVNVTNGTSNYAYKDVAYNQNATFQITPNSGLNISDATVIGDGCLIDTTTGVLTASNVMSNITCTVVFNASIADIMEIESLGERTDGWVSYSTDGNTKNYTAGVYETNDTIDGSTVYYYSGDVQNNWVRFGDNGSGTCYYWRIIRTNTALEGGGIRLLYAGSSTSCSGSVPIMTNAYINSSTQYYTSANNSSYIGYMFTEGEQHGHGTSSTIKEAVDSWYTSSGLSNFASYINENAIYCNDRSTTNETISNTFGDYGTWRATGTTFSYAAGYRAGAYYNSSGTWVYDGTPSPTLECTNSEDKFSKGTVAGGNGYLNELQSSPLALMTSDELIYAGANWHGFSYSYYYYASDSTSSSTGTSHWWTMSPVFWYGSYSRVANAFIVYGSGYPGTLSENSVNNSYASRPVVSLKSSISVTGSGTVNDPYIVTPPVDIPSVMANDTLGKRTDGWVSYSNNGTTKKYTAGLYETDDTIDGSTVYYYSGDVQNNWVRFGDNGSGTCYYWRIIRTNTALEGGGIRLLYAGSSTSCSGSVPIMTNAYINSSTQYYTSANNSSYIGYMFTAGEQHGYGTSSTIKGVVDSWYTSSGLSNFASYINENAIYCNDRSTTNETISNTFGDYGTWRATGTTFSYAAGYREGLYYNSSGTWVYNGTPSPTLECSNSEDKFSKGTSAGGNGYLSTPLALMTSDELIYAGANWHGFSYSYYYYASDSTSSSTGTSHWWTMSPVFWYGSYSRVANAFIVYGSGYPGTLSENSVNNSYASRPVVSLKSSAFITGSGTVNDPYVVE